MDKEKIHIDEEFMNQSWANMSAILDQEMPVKKRKRRFVWLWFGGLLTLTLIVIAFLINPSSNKREIAPINTKKQLNVAENKTKVADNQLIDLKKESTQKTPISTITKSSDTPNSVNTINTIKNLTLASPSESSKSNIDSEAGILKDGSQLSVVGSQLSSGSNKSEISLNNITSQTNISIDNKAVAGIENTTKNRKALADFSPIPSLNFSPFYNKELSLSFPTFPVKNKGNWNFGIYAGKTYPKFGSFRTGVHAQKIINRKWSIYFGLGYARRVAKISANGDQSLNADASTSNLPIGVPEMEDTMTGASTNQDPLGTTSEPEFTATASIAYQNFHYFELPIMIQYQLTNRWSLELGGQVNLLYGFRYKNDLDQSSTFSTDTETSDFDLVRSSGFATANISAWDFTALGGTAFQLNPNLQLYSNYRLSLNNYLSNPTDVNNSKKWRQIELGVRYYFK